MCQFLDSLLPLSCVNPKVILYLLFICKPGLVHIDGTEEVRCSFIGLQWPLWWSFPPQHRVAAIESQVFAHDFPGGAQRLQVAQQVFVGAHARFGQAWN